MSVNSLAYFFATVCFAIGGGALIISALFFVLHLIFEYNPERLGKSRGFLKSTKQKSNVSVYERSSPKAPQRLTMIIKNLSKSVYEYEVNGRKYRVRYTDPVKASQMPITATVVYLKRFPRISYVETDTNSHNFGIYAFAALIFAIVAVLGGISAIFKA